MARFAKCASPADMKAQFGNAGIVCSYRVVFNIKGMTTARRRLARLARITLTPREPRNAKELNGPPLS